MTYEVARRMHMQQYGSFLYCADRDTLCDCMNAVWKTGRDCRRSPCILDDPEYQKLQQRIERNRMLEMENRRKEEKAEPIRDQRNYIKSHKQQMFDEIHRLEEESAKAFRENKPNLGESLFNKARIMRGELWRSEHSNMKNRGEEHDRQSDQETDRGNDENRRSAGTDGGRTPDEGMHQRIGSGEAARAREILKGTAQADMGRGAEA